MLLLVFIVLTTRSLTRSTGMRPRTLDLTVIIVIGAVAAFLGLWPLAYLSAAFFYLAHRLEPDDSRYRNFAWTALLIALPLTFLHRGSYAVRYEPLVYILFSVILIAALAAFFSGIYTKSLCDKRGNLLECKRIKAALAYTTGVVLVLLASFGNTAIQLAYPLLICIIISYLANLFFPVRTEVSEH